MQIRNLSSADDLCRAAELLWLADPYIMGDLFGSRENASRVGAAVFSADENALFAFPRVLVAEEDGALQGILCWRDGPCRWDRAALSAAFEAKNIALPPQFDRVNDRYFTKLSGDSLPPDSTECMFLAVAEEARCRGVGRALLRQWMAMAPYTAWCLDVLAANEGAIRLYRQCGFRVQTSFDAYPPMENHRCLHMVREAAQGGQKR